MQYQFLFSLQVLVLNIGQCFKVTNGVLLQLFTARCCAERDYVTISRLSVCPFVRAVEVCFYTGWKTSKK